MNKAIFFDRDGVINEEIFNKKINQWSAPHTLNQVKIRTITLKSLKNLNKKNFLLFIVSLKNLSCCLKKLSNQTVSL